ncbi:hypothetical protein MTR67_023435 [Solanum verrucosum]|uniref:Uncharacterized protein n=1 Tax=Solanum verrucosum TaxID=315347 RepID=A0AAF0QWH2_SOLVR|nr:hypothetical protein MTR67_023435 [Solanum verrucosum]
MADALSRNTSSMGSLASISIEERPLAIDVHRLPNNLVRLQIFEETGSFIPFIEAHSSLVEQIFEHHFDDEKLYLIREKMLRGEAKEVILDCDGVMRIRVRICVPKKEFQFPLYLIEVTCSLPISGRLYNMAWVLGARWDQNFPLTKFTYNNSYHSSIQMAPLETLYGRWCRTLI